MPDRLPLHEAHVAAGARFGAPCGWDLPLDYGDAAGEYAAVRRGAGVVDRSHHGILEVTGKDRASFLHAMLSNDIKSLAPGQGCAASFLDNHGKIQAFVTVLALDDRLLLLTPAGHAEKTMQDLDTYLFSEKAYFRDATGESALFLVAGPGTASTVETLGGAMPPDRTWSHVAGSIADTPARVVRGGGETGETEAWIIVAATEAEKVWQAIVASGARPIGLAAFESLRIEAGTPLLGHDATDDVLLPEIPFDDRVSYTKGCYIGQEVVVRIRDRGHVNRVLRGLAIDGRDVPAPGASIVAGGGEIGRVTSGTWSFGLDRPIALGFVKRGHADAGTAVDVVAPGHAPVHATVSALPFTR